MKFTKKSLIAFMIFAYFLPSLGNKSFDPAAKAEKLKNKESLGTHGTGQQQESDHKKVGAIEQKLQNLLGAPIEPANLDRVESFFESLCVTKAQVEECDGDILKANEECVVNSDTNSCKLYQELKYKRRKIKANFKLEHHVSYKEAMSRCQLASIVAGSLDQVLPQMLPHMVSEGVALGVNIVLSQILRNNPAK